MLNSTTLEVAVGMALVYLLLSLFCTAMNEGIAALRSSRAKNLVAGMDSLFSNGAMRAADKEPAFTFAQAIYDHGLIQSLYRSNSSRTSPRARSGVQLPSYIPSRTFAAALFDILFERDKRTSNGDARPDGSAPALDLSTMLKMLYNLPDSKAREALATLVRQSNGDVVKTREAFAQWFDDGMDRCAGWYKRKTQRSLFLLGLFVALSLNVDSIAVARALWNSPSLRAYAVTLGEQYGKTKAPAATQQDALTTLQSLPLPLGWTGKHYGWHSTGPDTDNLLFAATGWLLTAAAMTMGAPFWFDTLNRFMVVRSTVKPREKSDVEPSKH